jgi:thioredoxin-related protein
MAMLPHERSLVTRLRNKPFVIVGVSADHTRKDVQEVQKSGEVTWRSWWFDRKQAESINRDWRVTGYPTICLIDHKGMVRYEFPGRPPEKELDRAIDELVREAENQ